MVQTRTGRMCRLVGPLLAALALAAPPAARAAQTGVIRGAELAPAGHAPDLGPEVIVGAEDGRSSGTHFDWVDVVVSGQSDEYRVYFDRQGSENFHFLDRRRHQLTLGLSEAGVEQALARGEAPGAPGEALRVARRGSKVGVYAGARLALCAHDDRCMGGTVGLRNYATGSPLSVAAQRREEIRFSDDFMREEKESSTWRKVNCEPGRGEFAIKSLRNPLMSANAFNYMGLGRGAMSVVGEPWWDNYRFEASLRGPKSARVGVVFAYQDERNYGLFRWTARPLSPDGCALNGGERELVRVREGREEILAAAPCGYRPHQWYRLEVLVTNARLRVSVDGRALFEARDPYLTAGGVGLWCDVPRPAMVAADPKSSDVSVNSLWELMNQHAVFDDVQVASLDSIEEDFCEPGPLAHGWLTGLGRWEVRAAKPGLAGELHAAGLPGESLSLIGDSRWGRYRLACDVDPGAGQAGLVFLYRDAANYFLARSDGRELELIEVAEGRQECLGRAQLKDVPAARQDGFLRLAIVAKQGYLKVTAADGSVVEAFEPRGRLRGRAGLYAAPGRKAAAPAARFRRFRVLFLAEPEPLVTTNAVFEDEESMSEWTSQAREWLPQQAPIAVDGQQVIPLWHSSQFPGDVELVIEPRYMLENRHELALSVSKDGRGAHNGYVFLYQGGRSDEKGQPVALLKMVRAGETVAEGVLPEGSARELSSLSLRRAGPYLVGKINGRPELVFRDPQPLTGSKVAYYAKGAGVRTESSRIISEHCLNELFARAPVEWRTAGYAIAEVTNRWQCDARWSFFCLKNDMSRGNPAVLWAKNLYPGDVSVEFFVGHKMERERGQPYGYARDVNVSICSNGYDLTKGYAFLWGGHGNQATCLYRDGVEVKRVERNLPIENRRVHRAWMLVRVEKRGNRISLHVDRIPEEPPIDLVYEDPQPLRGDRVAIWTYNHAVMLSRARITGEGGDVKESPDEVFPPVKTIYDRP